MEEISVIERELTRILDTIESGQTINSQWRQFAWGKASRIATQAAELAGMVGAIEKLAVYAIYTGQLWRAAFETQEEWIGDLNVHRGLARGTVFGIIKEIKMARRIGKTWEEVALLLARTPSALRDAANYWLDEDGELRQDLLVEPDEALNQIVHLSPTEARAHVKTVANMPNRFISDAAYSEGLLMLTLVVEEPDESTRVLDLVVAPSNDEEFTKADARYISRRLGKQVN